MPLLVSIYNYGGMVDLYALYVDPYVLLCVCVCVFINGSLNLKDSYNCN